MSVLEISGIVVTVVFIIYFLFVRSELKANNQELIKLRIKLSQLDADLSSNVIKLLEQNLYTFSWVDEGVNEEKQKSHLRISIEEILKPLISREVDGEFFIDSVVKRINNKQIG